MIDPEHPQFQLDDDEMGHAKLVGTDVSRTLGLANEATILASDLAWEYWDRGSELISEEGILALLVLKASEHLRLATMGLHIGHYSGVPALLRGAVDCVGILVLIQRDSRNLAKWVEIESSEKAELQDREKFCSEARRAYNSLFEDDPRKGVIWEHVQEMALHVHPTLRGIYQRVNVDAFALDWTRIRLSQFGKVSAKRPVETVVSPPDSSEEDSPDGDPLFSSAWLLHYAEEAHATAHHLCDVVEALVAGRASKETIEAWNVWHRRSLAEFHRGQS